MDGAITHVSKYSDSTTLLDVHAGGDTFAWVHVSSVWSDFRLSDQVVTGVYDFYRGAPMRNGLRYMRHPDLSFLTMSSRV